MTLSQLFFGMTFDDNVNTDFMFYLFLDIDDAWSPYINDGSTVKNSKASAIKSLDVYIPSLSAQDNIAKFMSQINELINENQKTYSYY